mgnify:CR=1 FL=1
MTKTVEMTTSEGTIRIELDDAKAPASTENFLAYVRAGHYDGTVFHRVIKGFMVQGGGFEPGMKQKPTREPVTNEASNGVKNTRSTLAMARTSAPAFGKRAVLHQHGRQRLPQLPLRDAAGLGLRGVRPRGVGQRRDRQDRSA